MNRLKFYILSVLSIIGFSACIENDIPYPIVAGDILAMEVEGQRGDTEGQNASAQIDKNKRTIHLFINDSADLSKLKITKLVTSPTATLAVDSMVCVNYVKFPTAGFVSLDSIPRSYNTRVNFTKPVQFLLATYQNYTWQVSVTQIYERTVEVEGMTDFIMDVENRQVVLYFPKGFPINQLNIKALDLGGKYGKVTPDPTAVTDLSSPKTFTVYQNGQEDNGAVWTVRAFYKSSDNNNSGKVFAMASRATVSGSVQSGKTPVVEYKKQNASGWETVSGADITVSGASFSATLTKLTPGTNYTYRVSVDGVPGAEQPFTTVAAVPLTNASFDEWSKDSKNARLWLPWANGGISFWDTGNKGATTVSESNSVPTEDTYKGSGNAAKLESKHIVVKFAAGNIFSGSYLRTDGTDGVLSFGREFNSFPTKLRIHYKYNSKTINQVGKNTGYDYLKGQPDSCHIYIALTDWDAPREIRTKPSELQVFDKNDKNVIAYAEFISGTSTDTYQELDLPLEYRYNNRTPKYIVVVASSSKYGDYFTGGEGSTLWIDDFELLYD